MDLNNKQNRPLASEDLSSLLDKYWPDIQSDYKSALKALEPAPTRRTDRHILEEILSRVRGVEVEYRRSEAPDAAEGDVLRRPVSVDSIAWYSLWRFPKKPVSEKMQAILLRDLNQGQYQTIGDIDREVNRARAAVEAYEAENPDLFKFSTDHITKSLGFVDPEFRTRHGFGARTRDAFKKYENLVSRDD